MKASANSSERITNSGVVPLAKSRILECMRNTCLGKLIESPEALTLLLKSAGIARDLLTSCPDCVISRCQDLTPFSQISVRQNRYWSAVNKTYRPSCAAREKSSRTPWNHSQV
jgi:hypothetical protein